MVLSLMLHDACQNPKKNATLWDAVNVIDVKPLHDD